jgi:hypothetical protein
MNMFSAQARRILVGARTVAILAVWRPNRWAALAGATILAIGLSSDINQAQSQQAPNPAGNTGTDALVVTKEGKVGIGTSNPKTALEVNGTFTADSVTTDLVSAKNVQAGELTATNTITASKEVKGETVTATNTITAQTITASKEVKGNTVTATNTITAQTITAQTALIGNVGIGTNGTTSRDLLQLGNYKRAADTYLSVQAMGGSQYRSGIKLRNHQDELGFTIEHDDRPERKPKDPQMRGLNIIRHDGTKDGVSALFIDRANGNIGIGTYPTKAKLEVGGGQRFKRPGFAYLSNSNETIGHYKGGDDAHVSIWASDLIMAVEFNAFSDARMKNVVRRSDAAQDLATLMKVEVADYTYKDSVARGGRSQKKVVGQQLKDVYPQAVSLSTDVVPDIYRQAEASDGWIDIATTLRKGDRVRIIPTTGDESIAEVVDVVSKRFRVTPSVSDGPVFVYGREVNDFHVVDYDAIAMLNVSATQQIKKEKDAEVKSLKAANAALRDEAAALRDEAAALRSRLERLEKLMDKLILAEPK